MVENYVGKGLSIFQTTCYESDRGWSPSQHVMGKNRRESWTGHQSARALTTFTEIRTT